MKKIIISITLIVITILFFSCSNRNVKNKAGVIISFDDYSVNEWCWADSILQKYGWKANFNISNFDRLDSIDFVNLRKLQSEGHEIAGHGFNHIDACETVEKEGLDVYLDIEIIPMIEKMNKELGGVSTFVYPFGNRNSVIDKELLKYFKVLRGTTYDLSNINNNDCYCNLSDTSHLIQAIGIDKSYEHMSIVNLKKKLDFAKKHNKVLVLYGHIPVLKSNESYRVEIATLEYICKYIKSNDMEFYTYSDLN